MKLPIHKLHNSAVSLIAASMLLFASAAVAGPKEKAQGKPGMSNIVEIAVAVNNEIGVFDTVLAAAQCSYFEGAVVAILAGENKVTLFAPVDGAFAELGLDDTNVCDAFNGMEGSVGVPEDLLGILAYHVTDGRRFSNSVFNRNGNAKEIEMILGSGYIVTEGGMVFGAGNDLDTNEENDNPIEIVGDFYDINASNGVIHVIDTVLIP